MKLSECLPDALLRRSEWYNDFVLACGVRDIVGTRLFETPSYRVIFGLHQQIGRALPHRAGSILNHRDGTAAALGAIAHGKPGDPERRRIRRAATRDGNRRVTFLFPHLQRPPIS
jgi:hypothetical protein